MRLSDDEAPVLGAVLAYIYNGRYFYPLPGTTLVDYEACMRFDAKVYVMADKYDVDFEDFDDKRDLKKLCANQFATNLGKVLENAALNVCGTDLIDIFKLVLDNTRETDRPLRAALVMVSLLGIRPHSPTDVVRVARGSRSISASWALRTTMCCSNCSPRFLS